MEEDFRREEERHTDTSLVLGILSIVFVAMCQIVGLILGIIGLHKARQSGRRSETGWVLNVIGIILNAVVIAAVIILLVIGLAIFSEFLDYAYYW